jgi:phosphopantetheinyl transferase
MNSRLKTKSDGAPYLNGYDQRLNISWSHAGECECIALSGSHSIGIDAECHGRLGTEPKELTKIIAPESTHALDELTLLSIWTAKEALLKISGRGLHQHDPNNIELPDSIINARTDLVQISKAQGICGERVALVNWTQSLPKPITITLALKRR